MQDWDQMSFNCILHEGEGQCISDWEDVKRSRCEDPRLLRWRLHQGGLRPSKGRGAETWQDLHVRHHWPLVVEREGKS